ncbi:hypothetical protein QE152_g16907 [Popillia japonica]|uniref:Uncharacterized protein n=1 Tax=Popillia japonica TaxID=7064 RepID=A0AAW1L701_POPJA
MISDEFSISRTPPELVEAVNTASLELLPKKSSEKIKAIHPKLFTNNIIKKKKHAIAGSAAKLYTYTCLVNHPVLWMDTMQRLTSSWWYGGGDGGVVAPTPTSYITWTGEHVMRSIMEEMHNGSETYIRQR